jgi:hypothetical protein
MSATWMNCGGFYNALDIFVSTSQRKPAASAFSNPWPAVAPSLAYPSKSVDGQILPDGGEIVEQDNVAELIGVLRRWLSNPGSLGSRRLARVAPRPERFDIRELSSQLWHEYTHVGRSVAPRPCDGRWPIRPGAGKAVEDDWLQATSLTPARAQLFLFFSSTTPIIVT